MERNSLVYVNDSITDREFRCFDLDKRHGCRRDYEKALSFFRERIQNRYLNQIRLLNQKPFENGFVSMAICCLLIDTFYQFEHGVECTTQNRVCYVDFLRNHLDDIFDTQEKADRFYSDIRCGILHSAQTKNGSMLSSTQNVVIKDIRDGNKYSICVSVVLMEERLINYYNDYCERIRHDEVTQSNFVKKLKKMFK